VDYRKYDGQWAYKPKEYRYAQFDEGANWHDEAATESESSSEDDEPVPPPPEVPPAIIQEEARQLPPQEIVPAIFMPPAANVSLGNSLVDRMALRLAILSGTLSPLSTPPHSPRAEAPFLQEAHAGIVFAGYACLEIDGCNQRLHFPWDEAYTGSEASITPSDQSDLSDVLITPSHALEAGDQIADMLALSAKLANPTLAEYTSNPSPLWALVAAVDKVCVPQEQPGQEPVAEVFEMEPLPKTYMQAMQCKNAEGWRQSMDVEYRNHMTKGTFKPHVGPRPKHVLHGMWV
jgi:hypothetical protein